MRTKRPGAWRVPSFEALLENAYGVDNPRLLRPPESAEQLLERYYGHEPKSKNKNGCLPRCSLHVGCDDATHTLAQRPRPNGRAVPAPAARLPVPAAAPAVTPRPVVPAPVPADFVPVAAAPADGAPAYAPYQPPPAVTDDAAPAVAASLTKRFETDTADTTSSDDDFISDMKSILDGTGAYDQKTKRILPRKEILKAEREESRAQSARNGNGNGNGTGEGDKGQAIFDRIARSMRHAGAYDLGDVELENRFADFDRMDELRDRPKKPARQTAEPVRRAPPSTGGAPSVDSTDFIEDLEAIQKQSIGEAEELRDSSIDIANAMKPKLSNPASVPGGYAMPFYGTGEHAIMAGDLYKDKLLVGKPPGVAFSYGELIAMGDFFRTVDDMGMEHAAKLTELRGLIRREVAGGSVSTTEWMKATRDRYIDLAEDNFEHFSPNLFFASKNFPRTALNRNHKQAWETLHERAIKEARKLSGGRPFPQNAAIPMSALIVNAFGDHFLTDAFAAGHIVNKQEITELFKSRFYSGGKLSEDGRAFLDKVAKDAWHGKVASRFEKLETSEPYDAWWNVVDWNPNISDAGRFAEVLKGVAEKAPDKIANLAVKAIHDHFNLLGIEVVNDAGNGPWKLTGDGHLTQETRKIAETAVRESAAHLTDAAVLSDTGSSFTAYFQRVWKYVPKLTAASANTLTLFVQGYIRPDNPVLVGKAATLIHEEVDTLIKQLIDKKALKPA